METFKRVPHQQKIDHQNCSECDSPMLLTTIEPDDPDYGRRTFECAKGDYARTEIIKII